ncbi:Fe2+ transport system protein A [Chthonomonas calidirosea]|uniref:Fe2+ transport system protein A n=1 Tax=Chthonomonas calidirosea (strain DSM 23976 / ICMP 18418 / T49) TaxID=1303518 RepID=S0ESI0_CHTCT|nr:FeoA family protein [Chthonomonas calidirosea]CCW34179.1 Fe2+ transport system protein A [Chthonomonas calidirosea T49]CEK15533.1 Fe2+ transport system protein A [Chthonomonas calidirosea]
MRADPHRHKGKKPGCWFSRWLYRMQEAQGALERAEAFQDGKGPRSLADLRPGECADVLFLTGTARERLRLMEMGLTPGVHVKVLRVAAFGGPLDVLVRGYQLSLRREEAAAVLLADFEEGS